MNLGFHRYKTVYVLCIHCKVIWRTKTIHKRCLAEPSIFHHVGSLYVSHLVNIQHLLVVTIPSVSITSSTYLGKSFHLSMLLFSEPYRVGIIIALLLQGIITIE